MKAFTNLSIAFSLVLSIALSAIGEMYSPKTGIVLEENDLISIVAEYTPPKTGKPPDGDGSGSRT